MSNKEIVFKRNDRSMHVAERFYTCELVEPILPVISKTFITPNMITIANIIFSFILFYKAYNESYIFCAIGIQIYLFLDVLDGNLARYKNMKSKLGAKLDYWCDTFFYNLIFIFLGINHVSWILILSVILLVNLYGIIATYYIVPRLRKLKIINRTGIKKYFMDRGYIIGMDLGTLDIIMSICLIFSAVKPMFCIIILGYILDILFRLMELKKNEKLDLNKGNM